jgi:PAS domain S-box-containing protein
VVDGEDASVRTAQGDATALDDAARGRRESALRASEQRLRAVLASLPVMVVAFDRDMVCTAAEGRGLAVLGLHPDEVVGKHIAGVAAGLPQMVEGAQRALDGMVSNGTLHVEDRLFEIYHSPTHDDGGEIVGGVGVAIDVTERHRAEQQVLRDAERFERGFLNSPVGMAVTGGDGRYRQVNAALCAMLGRSQAELLGHEVRELVAPADRADDDEMLQRMHQGETSVHLGERRYTHPSRGVVHMLVTITAVHDDSGALDYCVHQVADITERRRMEQALRDSNDRLRKSDAERLRLLTHLVHAQEEERTRIAADVHDDSLPALAAVKMRLEMLAGTLDDERRGTLQALLNDVDAATTRLRRLLFQLHPGALDSGTLGEAVEQLLDESLPQGMTTHVVDSLAIAPPPGTSAVAYRIVQEAVANIAKHAGAHSVEVHLDDHDGGVLASVRDDGAGFDYEKARRAQVPGHLGLSTMRERAEIAGGWLGVESAPGRGTVVGFWIPRST